MSEYTMKEMMQLVESGKPVLKEADEIATLEEVIEMQMNMGGFIKNLKENMDENFEALADLLKEQAEFMQNFDERITNLEELLSSDRTIN